MRDKIEPIIEWSLGYGLWSEHFDCLKCHHSHSALSWIRQIGATGFEPHINDGDRNEQTALVHMNALVVSQEFSIGGKSPTRRLTRLPGAAVGWMSGLA